MGDADQAHRLRFPTVTLYHDDNSVILAGPHRGRDLDVIANPIRRAHIEGGRDVREYYALVRPWWRFWRDSWVLRIESYPRVFQQSFCDGGHR